MSAEGRRLQEIVEQLGVSNGSVWRTMRGPVRTTSEWQPRPGRLTLANRVEIAVGLRAGDSFTHIAGRLGVSVGTVSREVGGRPARGRYDAERAHRRARRRARRPKILKLDEQPTLRHRVIRDLEAWWSPEQIGARLRRDFPDNPEMRVSHETIYKSLYVQGKGALRKEIAACLRSGREARRRRFAGGRPASADLVRISERPPEASDRAVPGHWEGDLIFGRGHNHAIGTLVERTTRFVLLFRPASPRAEDVREAMTEKIQALPKELFKTLTWDRGSEMASHRRFTIDTGVQIYFCDPRSPWQRGTNENTNGLLRQYFPKGSDFSLLSEADLDAAAASLNDRPRETLDWLKPAEALAQLLALTP